jgi:uncharacterized membrane protein
VGSKRITGRTIKGIASYSGTVKPSDAARRPRAVADGMSKSRLEAFSDGAISTIIAIMVLELKVPRGETVEALRPLVPVFLNYVLSFVYGGI